MFCPKCGVKNLDTSKFCKACGKPLPDHSQIRQAVSQSLVMPPMPQNINLIGQVLEGKYRIEARLGTGGMGEVYRATRLLIGDAVAIKFLHTHLVSNPQAVERFRHEAVTATKLRHRNVVALYDVGISVAHNAPYILMEFAEGLTLRQIINHSKVLPLDFAVTVIAQVCAALDEAHRLGIVHRDIKPENIIANQTSTGWHVKVLDFGIAKLYNEANSGLTQDGSTMGTPQYMSPEQCMGEPIDGRSDIYSAAIVLYEMFCGTVPFKHATTSAIAIHQVQTAPPPPRSINPNITPEMESVILRALSKQREARQQTAQIFAQEFIRTATAAVRSAVATTNSAPLQNSTIGTKQVEVAQKENSSLPIPLPEDNFLSSEIKPEHIANQPVNKKDEEKLSLIFEDAEFILDEILVEKKADEISDFENSQPILKPSEPYQ